jgi:8-oxo-dGTP diphosphatase
MIRRFDAPPRPGIAYRLRPGVYAIVRRGGRVLLTRQAAPVPEVQLPGGGIDPGEHPLRALHREVLEETGWTIGAVRRLGAYRRFTFMPEYDLWAEKLCTVYLAVPGCRVGPPSEPGHSALWAPLLQAAGMVASPGDGHFLSRLA